jgi:hypothetical protein
MDQHLMQAPMLRNVSFRLGVPDAMEDQVLHQPEQERAL